MTIQIKDLLNNFDTSLLNKKNITKKFLNVYLVEDETTVSDVEKISHEKDGERMKYEFYLKDIVFTIYDNPMRAIREYSISKDYKEYKTWNKDGTWTTRD